MRNPQVDVHGHDVAGLPRLHVGRVVSELETLAEVEVASGSLVALISSGEFAELLDVGGVVLLDGVDEGRPAGGGRGFADAPGRRGGDYAVREDGGYDGQESGGGGEVHVEDLVPCELLRKLSRDEWWLIYKGK